MAHALEAVPVDLAGFRLGGRWARCVGDGRRVAHDLTRSVPQQRRTACLR